MFARRGRGFLRAVAEGAWLVSSTLRRSSDNAMAMKRPTFGKDPGWADPENNTCFWA